MRHENLSYMYAEDDSEIAINISHSRFKNARNRGKLSPGKGFIESGMVQMLNRVVSHQGMPAENNLYASQTPLKKIGRIKSAVGERKPASGVQFRQTESINNINVRSGSLHSKSNN